jgi:molecular chaperone GrpE
MDDNRTTRDTNLSEASETAGAAVAADALSTDELQRQRDDYYDRLLRKTAEFDNFRKRTERERQTLSEAAAADLIEELLPLVDDLERALQVEAGTEGADAYRRGVEMIHKRLLDLLAKRGVRPVDTEGALFDPHYHQAVSYEPSSAYRDGEIIEEFRRGYMLGDRLLRPSMVKVAKGAA